MFARYVILSLLVVAFMSPAAFADGGFYGTVTYSNCDCTGMGGDIVRIKKMSTGQMWDCDVGCRPCCGYNTGSCGLSTFPPGTYRLWVVVEDNCHSLPKTVEHGHDWQEVNIKVYGAAQ